MEINASSEELSATVKVVEYIKGMAGVISSIAEQTNLLALNDPLLL